MQINRLVMLDDDQEYLKLFAEFAQVLNVKFEGYNDFEQIPLDTLTPNDLLLLDVFMPEKDALDIIFELANINFNSSIAVASGADSDVLCSIKTTAQKFNIPFAGTLQKPVKLEAIATLLNSVKRPELVIDNNPKAADERRLVQAVEKLDFSSWFDKGYLYPVFQPQFNSANDELVGIECLTRLCHPEFSQVTPFEFISALERCDKINIYTIEFIKFSLSLVMPYMRNYPKLTCSFNISAHNLDKDFADNLVTLFTEYRLPAEQITLEITESIAIKMSAEALYAISRLKLFGAKLAIDDFGTGYSSISQLVDLPFDEIKLDRSFVCQLTTNPKAIAIVNATFNLASSLKFNLVVEGVENQEQLHLLKNKGECVIQGYILSKPLLAKELINVGLEHENSIATEQIIHG